MPAYNLTNLVNENTTGLLSFVQGVNTELVSGFLGVLILIGLGVVLIMSFHYSTQDTKKSIAATTFILLTIALLFRAINLIENKPLFLIVIACAIAMAFTWR